MCLGMWWQVLMCVGIMCVLGLTGMCIHVEVWDWHQVSFSAEGGALTWTPIQGWQGFSFSTSQWQGLQMGCHTHLAFTQLQGICLCLQTDTAEASSTGLSLSPLLKTLDSHKSIFHVFDITSYFVFYFNTVIRTPLHVRWQILDL